MQFNNNKNQGNEQRISSISPKKSRKRRQGATREASGEDMGSIMEGGSVVALASQPSMGKNNMDHHHGGASISTTEGGGDDRALQRRQSNQPNAAAPTSGRGGDKKQG